MDLPATTSLPAWFWVFYYAFLLVTVGTSVFFIIRDHSRTLSAVNLLFGVTSPIVHFAGAAWRPGGVNEFELLLEHLIQGNLWAVYVSVAYIFILTWWALVFGRYVTSQTSSSH